MRWLAKNTTVRSLAIKRKTGTVTLRSDEFELTVSGTLSDIGIQIEKRINIATIAWKFGYRDTGDGVADGLVFRMTLSAAHRH